MTHAHAYAISSGPSNPHIFHMSYICTVCYFCAVCYLFYLFHMPTFFVSLLSVNLGKKRVPLIGSHVDLSSALKTNIRWRLLDGSLFPSPLLYRGPFTFMTHTHTQTLEIKIKALVFVIVRSYFKFQQQSFFATHSAKSDVVILLVKWPSWHPDSPV